MCFSLETVILCLISGIVLSLETQSENALRDSFKDGANALAPSFEPSIFVNYELILIISPPDIPNKLPLLRETITVT